MNDSVVLRSRATLDKGLGFHSFSPEPVTSSPSTSQEFESSKIESKEDEGERIESAEENIADVGLLSVSATRLKVIVLGLWISLFLSALETTIVSTALLNIADDLHSVASVQWIVVVYLLTYNAFLLITAKLSDTFGVKVMIVGANLWFAAASLGCGFAQTMTQLIILRALQGIGGSGMYSIVFVILAKIVPMDKIGLYSGVLSSVFALASTLGPVLGGIITDHTTWRWIFWLNGPGVLVALAILVPALPGWPDQKINKERLKSIDMTGGALSLGWSIPLLFALQEAGSQYAWDSSVIIGTLTSGGVGFILFVFYEVWVEAKTKREPMFPVKLLRDPVTSMLILSMFLAGAAFYVAIIEIPQRLQSVNAASAAHAGVLLLPLTLVTPVVSLVSGTLLEKKPHIPEYISLTGTLFVAIAIALLGFLPTDQHIPKQQFAYQALLGIGLGMVIPPLLFILKVEIPDGGLASAMGATTMSRTLGGCIALALCTAASHSKLTSSLHSVLTGSEVSSLLKSFASVTALPADEQSAVRRVYGESFNTEFQVTIAFAVANVVSTVFLCLARRRKRRGGEAGGDGNGGEH